MQGVSVSGQLVAASWIDGNPVNIISSADGSDVGHVYRLIGKESLRFPAPTCVGEYNKHMQGVDRFDQLRAKYSLADGHSMKKWHKKLALAFIDIARVNAYITKRLRDVEKDSRQSRNPHRDFMIQLATELINGSWKTTAIDDGFSYGNNSLLSANDSIGSMLMSSPPPTPPATPTAVVCEFVMSGHEFPDATRGKRGCRVCMFEGRTATMVTNYCKQHKVCLCALTYPAVTKPGLAKLVCPNIDWNCWRKYHEYYLPSGLFNAQGHIRRSSTLFKAKKALFLENATTSDTESTAPVESPATLVFSPFDGVRANAEAQSDYSDEGATPRSSNPPDTTAFDDYHLTDEGRAIPTAEHSDDCSCSVGSISESVRLLFSPTANQEANTPRSSHSYNSPHFIMEL